MNSNILSLYTHACRTIYNSEMSSYKTFTYGGNDMVSITTHSNLNFTMCCGDDFALFTMRTGYTDQLPTIPFNLKSLIQHWMTVCNVSGIKNVRVTSVPNSNIIKSVEINKNSFGYNTIIDIVNDNEILFHRMSYNKQYYSIN